MGKTMNTTLVLGAKMSPSFKAAFTSAAQQAQKTSKVMSGVGSAVKATAGIVASAFAVGKIVEFGKESVTAYNESIEAQTKLTTIMKQRMGASSLEIQNIVKLTAAQQKLGVIEDDTQVAGAQQLATFLKSSNNLKTLIPAMNDLAVQQNGVNVTSESMVGIGNLMGKAMMGNAGALRKVGITFSDAEEKIIKYGNEQQRAAILSQVITENVGKMNAAIAATPEGKFAQIKNKLGDMKEDIGKGIMNAAMKLLPLFDKILAALNKIDITTIFAKINASIDWVIAHGDMLLGTFKNIAGIILTVAAAFVTYNAVLKAQLLIEKIQKGYRVLVSVIGLFQSGAKLATVAQLLLNGAMEINPIGLIVAGIVLLVAGFLWLWNNCEGFRNFFIGMWDGIKKIFTGFIDFVKTNWQTILSFILNPFGTIFKLLYEKCAVFRGFIDGLVGGIKSLFGNIWSGLKNGFVSFLNFVINGINFWLKIMLTPINLLIKGLNLIPGVKLPEIALAIPKIPKFANGGTVNSPTVGLFGEAGPETIVPHNNKPRSRALLAAAAAGQGGGLGGKISIEINVGGNPSPGVGAEIADELERRLDRYFREKGRVAFG